MRGWKRVAGAAAAATGVAVTAVTALVGVASSAEAHPVAIINANGTAVRTAPSTSTAAVRTRLSEGTPVEISCQDTGDSVDLPARGVSAVWDLLPAYKGWVSDLLVNGGDAVQACKPAKAANLLATARKLAGGRASIGFNPFAVGYGDQDTYYAESRMAQQTGKFMPVYGQAYQWPGEAKLGGWTVGNRAELNAVAVFPRGTFGLPQGHAGWVVAVKGHQVRIQDYNWRGVGATVTDHWVQVVPGTTFIYADR